ncbi:MAG: winged helix-turn-helix transcriptional regulator [Gammaproteobacteria bacterium]|nr:winged helix-turn-helix transcriptional regulator [Gammaproteobacteria bacterium]MBV8403765.1 winged helix-turn-helix transcriptional regulator [Gammaproteobacteria bacterium]
MQQAAPERLTKWLRAAAEPTRLRLLALCAEAPLSVSDLAQALKQSEPRVSRHLKILCESGLIERLRQGQWVHYRLASEPRESSFARGLLAQLDRRDPLLLRDLSGARKAAAAEGQTARYGAESRLGRALAEFLAAARPGEVFGSVLVAGLMHAELLEWAARASRHCTALAPSRRAAQGARAFVERRGFACRVLPHSPAESFSASLARAGTHFDAVLLDHPATSEDALVRVLEDARVLIEPEGQLWIFEPYDVLEGARDRVVEHPLARLRRLLTAAGLRCERLSPIEADGAHVLAAVARPAAAGPALGLAREGAAR